MTVFFDDWGTEGWNGQKGYTALLNDFAIPAEQINVDDIRYASYSYENYSGEALVIFERDGKVYEVNGGHCSCYGLEGQWVPEETSWLALAARHGEGGTDRLYQASPESLAALHALLSLPAPGAPA